MPRGSDSYSIIMQNYGPGNGVSAPSSVCGKQQWGNSTPMKPKFGEAMRKLTS